MPSARPILAAVAVALAAAPLLGRPASAEDKVVNVYNWSDYIDPSDTRDVHQGNRDQGRLRHDGLQRGPGNEAPRRQHRLRRRRADRPFLQRQITGRRLPAARQVEAAEPTNMLARDLSKLAAYDPGNEYAVNYMWGTTGIGYNVDKVKERSGGDADRQLGLSLQAGAPVEVQGLRHLRARHAGRIVPGRAQLSSASIPNCKNPDDIEKAGELCRDAAALSLRKFHSSDYINALANGDICLAVGWSGDVLQARSRAGEAHDKSPDKPARRHRLCDPEGGRPICGSTTMAIPKDAEHVEEAHAFIDYLMKPEVAARTRTSSPMPTAISSRKS